MAKMYRYIVDVGRPVFVLHGNVAVRYTGGVRVEFPVKCVEAENLDDAMEKIRLMEGMKK